LCLQYCHFDPGFIPEFALQPGEKSFIYGKHFSEMNEMNRDSFYLLKEGCYFSGVYPMIIGAKKSKSEKIYFNLLRIKN
jgi:hypothetical protein